MILITGATGLFGTATIKYLTEKKGISPKQIAALVRNEQKAQGLKTLGINIRPGNYDAYGSLVQAFRGAEKILFISGSEIEKRERQHENVVRAAKETGTGHIIYTSFYRNDDDENSPVAFISKTHIETEKMIQESGLKYTFMRNSIYAEYVSRFIGDDIVEKGIFFPAGNGKVPFASRDDMAEAAAGILAGSNEHHDKSYRTVNTRNYTFYDIAEILSEIKGKKITYISPSPEEFTKVLSQSGIPMQNISMITGWAEGIRDGYFESEFSDLEKLLGRQPADLSAVLAGLTLT